MAYLRQFEQELDNLFLRRTHWLRGIVGARKTGKRREFDRTEVDKGIERLQKIASESFAGRMARTEFKQYVSKKKNYLVKGRGPEEKKRRFETWFSREFPTDRGFVYAFWGDAGKSIYVGRTDSHTSRPSSHFDKYWFPGVKRVTIFSVKGKSHIPKLECLAIHHFQPSRNKNKASTRKWTKACPLCRTHRHIEEELRSIFRFK